MKVFVVGTYKNYARWINNAQLVDSMEDADLVMFTGGEDIHPKLYGERKLSCTYANNERDALEKAAFERAVKLNKRGKKLVCFGTCRGAQLLCALNGGKVIQDVFGHAIYGTHPITDGNQLFEITSLHHQMMYPFNLKPEDYDIVFKSVRPLSEHYDGGGIEIEKMIGPDGRIIEPEIVLFHQKGMPRCICVQGHPEMMRDEAPIVKFLNDFTLSIVNSVK